MFNQAGMERHLFVLLHVQFRASQYNIEYINEWLKQKENELHNSS